MLTIPCDQARFTFNDIYQNQATSGSALYHSTSNNLNDIDARLNYWGTNKPAQIESAIYHQIDNPALGLVDYTNHLPKPISQLPRLFLPFVIR